jgi:hypothetical protein
MQALNEEAAPPRSVLMKFLVPSWEYRRPRISAYVHFAAGSALVGVTIVLLSYGYWWGALLLLAAALHLWLGYFAMTVARSAPSRI